MEGKGRVKEVFPGGNTSVGFYSFYDYIVDPWANRIFVIKGGPGVGKSTFMRKIADALLETGVDLEFHHCSSDNHSLDGIYIPAIDTALIDGTAPHIFDPRNPGAVDTIIHLGDYWDEAGMRRDRDEILKCNREVGRLFKRAYGYLAAAKVFNDQRESCYIDSGSVDYPGLNEAARKIIGFVLGDRAPVRRKPRDRHLFASAITPDGPCNYLESVVGDLPRRVVLKGAPGTGKTTIVKRVSEAILLAGYDVELFHCALDPTRIDHLVAPELGIALVNGSEPHLYDAKAEDYMLDTAEYVDTAKLARFSGEIAQAHELYDTAFATAVDFIRRAKAMHDEMETHYVPNMRFGEINAKRDETLSRLLRAVAEAKAAAHPA